MNKATLSIFDPAARFAEIMAPYSAILQGLTPIGAAMARIDPNALRVLSAEFERPKMLAQIEPYRQPSR